MHPRSHHGVLRGTVNSPNGVGKVTSLPLVRKSPTKLECLLHAEFEEVSRSGVYLQKEDVLVAFEQANRLPTIHSEAYRLVYADGEIAIITYATACVSEAGTLFNHALRSSTWLQAATNWQLIFHQGTPTEPTLENS